MRARYYSSRDALYKVRAVMIQITNSNTNAIYEYRQCFDLPACSSFNFFLIHTLFSKCSTVDFHVVTANYIFNINMTLVIISFVIFLHFFFTVFTFFSFANLLTHDYGLM